MCLLRRSENIDLSSKINYQEPDNTKLTREELTLTKAFLDDTLRESFDRILPNHILKKQGNTICLVPADFPLLPHHSYLSGVSVGTVTKGRLEPHHHYFSAMGAHFSRKIELSCEEKDAAAYLHGETLKTDLSNGYAVVTVAGAAIGGAKIVNGVAKNHYPKGLRNP